MGIVVSQLTNGLHVQSTHLGRPFGWPLQSALAQGFKACRVLRDVVVVQPVVGDEFMHQGQSQCCIGARLERQVHIAFVGGFAAARVDADQLGTLAFGLLRESPEMHAAGDGVAAPNQDEFAFCKKLHLHAQLAAEGLRQCFGTCAGAYRAVQLRSPQQIEKTHGDGLALHHAHGAGVAVGEDALRVARCNALEFGGDGVQGFVPTHPHELTAALGTAALQGMQHPLGVVGALGVARHLGAQDAIGERVVRVALHLHRHAVLHGGQQRTGVGTVVGASAQDGGGHGAITSSLEKWL